MNRKERCAYKITLRLSYGLTDKMITALGEADGWTANPHYHCAPRAALYAIERVERFLEALDENTRTEMRERAGRLTRQREEREQRE